MSTCPVCTADQPEGLLCHNDTTRLETMLAEIPWLVDELAITISKQSKIGKQTGKGAPAHERNPINYGALTVLDELTDTLIAWLNAVCAEGCASSINGYRTAYTAAHDLGGHIPQIRKHPNVADLIDEIADAIARARQSVDRPADRQFLGPCYAITPDDEGRDVTCLADIWAKTAATTATCRTCGITHEVEERRTWLLEQAADRIVTPREAAHLIGNVGHIDVNATRIRNWLNRKQLPMRPGPTDEKHFRLGDLLILLAEKQEKVAA